MVYLLFTLLHMVVWIRLPSLLAPSPEIRATKIPDEEDYMLTMADVQKAQVRAQLVVLSCCHSWAW